MWNKSWRWCVITSINIRQVAKICMHQPTWRPLKVPREGINTRGEIVTKWWRAVCESCIISGCSCFIRIAFQPFQGPKQTEWWILFLEICPKREHCSCTILATSGASERGGGVYVCLAVAATSIQWTSQMEVNPRKSKSVDFFSFSSTHASHKRI